MSKKVCFIGHRDILLNKIVEEKLNKAIQNEINSGCRYFTMGTHGEFDKMALSTCRKFRNIYNDIEIVVVLTSLHKIEKKILKTYQDEESKTQIVYNDYYSNYDDVKTTMFYIENIYFKNQITESNKKMIDGCDALICYVDTKKYKSGAKIAMNYAKKNNLQIINLYDEKDFPTFGMNDEEKNIYFNSKL